MLNLCNIRVQKALKKKDGKVTLVGFGTFSKVRRKEREGRNPQTGAKIKIKARNAVKFKPGKALKDSM
ncbi:MAG: HU family DNA-binding protein [Deltaproteobacteria bacterium]|nr:HU family DNA-binding protein [Deltaproteobacteria bacterium]